MGVVADLVRYVLDDGTEVGRDGAAVGPGHRHSCRGPTDRPHRPGDRGGGRVVAGRTLLATGSWDETAWLWDPATGTPVGQPAVQRAAVTALTAIAPGRLTLATGNARSVRSKSISRTAEISPSYQPRSARRQLPVLRVKIRSGTHVTRQVPPLGVLEGVIRLDLHHERWPNQLHR